MRMDLNSRETEYLLCVLRAAVKGTKAEKPPESMDWNAFLKLSKMQEVYSIVAQTVDFKYLPADIAGELNDYSKSELVRLIAMQNELNAIKSELAENGIKYMLLKGAVVRNYYPKQSMRQMSDIDILYDPDKREALLALMNARGYTLISNGGNSDDFTKKPYYTFEFHRELFKDAYGFCPDFSVECSHAQNLSDHTFEYIMSAEDLYLHHVAHMYKHYLFGGFGIRFIVDTYLILKNAGESMSRDYISRKLAEMKLTDFEDEVRGFSFSLLENRALTDKQRAFFNTALVYGIYGSNKTNVDEAYKNYKNNKGGNTFGYFISRIFPAAAQMKSMYPKLNKHPVLLGFYYFKRLFEKAFSSKDKVRNEIKTVKRLEKEQKNHNRGK